jgi:uncharacterized protein (TIGR02391 family)
VFTTTAEVDRTIAKLKRRIQDIQSLEQDHVRYSDDRVDNVQHQIRDTIRAEFGEGSPQYDRHRYFKIDDTPATISFYDDGGARAQHDLEASYTGAKTRIEGLIQQLLERREELEEPEVAPRAIFAGRTLNPVITTAAKPLYDSGHHALAVFEASKALINLVKAKSERQEDGVALMRRVFSRNSPILAFNDLADQSDMDEQEGMMHLYEGAAMAVRNTRGHRVGVTDAPERALQYLEVLSLLADRLDETKKLK